MNTPRTDALTKRMAGELDRPMLRQDHFIELCDHARQLERDLAAAQLELAELKRGKVLADGMSNVIRGFILKRAERETLDEVAAKYRKWEEDYSHSNFTKDAP